MSTIHLLFLSESDTIVKHVKKNIAPLSSLYILYSTKKLHVVYSQKTVRAGLLRLRADRHVREGVLQGAKIRQGRKRIGGRAGLVCTHPEWGLRPSR
jgi:hypothetical protein